ncbi:hypothetical protein [Roseibacillus persicicus]|uniref:Tetratricopeptide repeat protein n=1 Tax=Roseibacillus persicicus TaxID=454148 RepID=A0A918WGH4_9BACT|nr:hypothetical protein [Roseibacillus persicicus]MDQ8191486.1 hypothetical protein [Roseibacillus persicicus]GHC42929.1 hypothetical protein GCM10007100_04900 [Roseibacillus persicicus]
MKNIIFFLACAASLSGQDLAPALIGQDGNSDKVWIEAASEKTIRYRENPKSLNRIDVPVRNVSVMFFTPAEFADALELYENRDYEKAQPAFKKAREKYKFVEDVPGNFSTLSGFYEIECARKLGKYEEIETLMSKFKPAPLLLETQKTQIEVYPLYNAVRTEDWARLNILCEEWADRKVPGSIRAQLEYCHGLALDGLGRLEDALIAFNKAFVADYTASEVLTKKAALACFSVYEKHPEVELARKLHGTPDENPNSTGALLLGEAAALVEMWQTALGRGDKLPDEYKAFLKYKKA